MTKASTPTKSQIFGRRALVGCKVVTPLSKEPLEAAYVDIDADKKTVTLRQVVGSNHVVVPFLKIFGDITAAATNSLVITGRGIASPKETTIELSMSVLTHVAKMEAVGVPDGRQTDSEVAKAAMIKLDGLDLMVGAVFEFESLDERIAHMGARDCTVCGNRAHTWRHHQIMNPNGPTMGMGRAGERLGRVAAIGDGFARLDTGAVVELSSVTLCDVHYTPLHTEDEIKKLSSPWTTIQPPIAATLLDGKFRGTIYRHTDNLVLPPDEWVVFLAKDNAFPATLRFYRQECERIGADAEQLAAVDRLIARVDAWRENNKTKLKIPDAVPGECH